MQRSPVCIAPELRESVAKVRRPRGRVAANRERQNDQSGQRERLGRGKDVLNHCAKLHAKDIDDAQRENNEYAGEVGGVQANIHIAQNHGPDRNGRNVSDMPEPVRSRNRRKEDAEELAEGDRDSGDGSRLDDQKQRPAVEKSPERAEGFAQVDVLAAGLGHHGGKFAVA